MSPRTSPRRSRRSPTSEDPYDVWFREHLASVHGMTAEMLQGPPPAEVFFEYRAAG